MAEHARIHHYIPQFYLRGFGWKRGKKNWHVHAADLKRLEYFQPNTKNICAERDFLRVEIEGQAPDKLETDMAKFEMQAREAILRVAQSLTFEGDDRITILNLMAVLAVRSPQMRENMRDFQERSLKIMMSLMLQSKLRWEGQIAQMKAAGVKVNEEVTYEQVKEFHEGGQYKINLARELQIGAELKTFEPVLRALVGRKWKLFHAGKDQGKFVTTDRPVVITWNHPDKVPPVFRHSPGFGMVDTEVVFPLTSECFLLGRFEGMEDGVEEAQGMLIARCNTRMISDAFDYAFMVDQAFPYIIPPDQAYFDDQFMQRAAGFRKTIQPEAPKMEANEFNDESSFKWPPEIPEER